MSHKKPPHKNHAKPADHVFPSGCGVPEENARHNQEHSTDHCNPPPNKKIKWGLTKFEIIIATLTALAVLTALCTALFIKTQISVMRTDQRPWVRVWIDPIPPAASDPTVSFAVHTLDSGKTPANSAHGDFFVEKVQNGTQPILAGDKPFAREITGTVFPNIQIDGGKMSAYPLSKPELEDLNSKKIFFVIYGTFAYKDFFHVQHWTRFCQPWIIPPGGFTYKKCTEYNEIDDN
jgi:hypothetical protein